VHVSNDPGSSRREAHLPAQQPSSCPQARVPFAHAYPVGSRHRAQPPEPWPGEAVGLIVVAPVSYDRLRQGRDVVAVLRSRRQRAGAFVVLHVRETGEARTRLTVLASRRVGNAVTRNRAKRVLRAAASTVAWAPGADIVLVARARAADAGSVRVAEELGQLAAALDLVSGATTTPGPARVGSVPGAPRPASEGAA
jgi:ribonuclease P protein component